MRIAIVGNQDNNGYRLCKWMRAMGVDADLFLFDADVSPRSQPNVVDPDLERTGFHSWMRRFEGFEPIRKNWMAKMPSGASVVSSEYDVALTAGYTGLLAGYWLRIPFAHLSLGSETTTLPHLSSQRGVPKDGLSGRIASQIARESLSRCFSVIEGYAPAMESLVRLGHLHKIRVFASPEDVWGNRARVDQGLLPELNKQYANCDRVILWLSRLNFSDKASDEYKGPEVFLQAFQQLVKDRKAKVRAIIGSHGNDVHQFKSLATEYQLDDHIDYVSHLPFWKLLTYLSIENAIVCDTIDPGKGGSSGMMREALSVGAVLVRSVDPALMALSYGADVPIANVWDVESCDRELARLVALDGDQFSALQQTAATWAENMLDYQHLVSRMVALLQEAAYISGVERSRWPADYEDVVRFTTNKRAV